MTPDLTAIRKWHTDYWDSATEEERCRHCGVTWPCETASLLAEVDRLTGNNERLQQTVEFLASERARIRAAVKELYVKRTKRDENDYQKGYRDSRNDTVAAVLALFDKEEA